MKIRALKAHRQEPVVMDGAIGARMRMLVGPEDGADHFHMRLRGRGQRLHAATRTRFRA